MSPDYFGQEKSQNPGWRWAFWLLSDCIGLEFGAGNRNRTYDLIITNDALYQLSYSGGAA
jgi:hypothetical protein